MKTFFDVPVKQESTSISEKIVPKFGSDDFINKIKESMSESDQIIIFVDSDDTLDNTEFKFFYNKSAVDYSDTINIQSNIDKLKEFMSESDQLIIYVDSDDTLDSTELNFFYNKSAVDNSDTINTQSNSNSLLERTEIKFENNVNISSLDEEYAMSNESKAVVDKYKMLNYGKYCSDICQEEYQNEKCLEPCVNMHDKHEDGSFMCDICHCYYETDSLLKSHMTEKHMCKYVYKKCPEINFNQKIAIQNYVVTHIEDTEQSSNPEFLQPQQINNKCNKTNKGVCIKPDQVIELPDFLVCTPLGHAEQYTIIQERQKSKNYLQSSFRCEMCYKGYIYSDTFKKHMKKHDPILAGPYQCDICKLHFRDTRQIAMHIRTTHQSKYSCQKCDYVCYNKSLAYTHYQGHMNVTFQCPHCNLEFKKLTTKLSHVRIKHPSTFICDVCGHSFVNENGLLFHKKVTHGIPRQQNFEVIPLDQNDPLYCADCKVQFLNEEAFHTHLGSSSKHTATNISSKQPPRPAAFYTNRRRAMECLDSEEAQPRRLGRQRRDSSEILNIGTITSTHCKVCNMFLANDVKARKHYESEHPGYEYLKRYMCDICGITTKIYANLKKHMRIHTCEKPYECPHCDRRFNMMGNRDRHILIHTGEKPFQCPQCDRRFNQSTSLKLHIRTVHLKIPYPPWNKKNRRRRIKDEFGNTYLVDRGNK